MTRRTRIISSVSAVILAIAGFLAYAAYQAGHVVIPNAYAVCARNRRHSQRSLESANNRLAEQSPSGDR